MIVTETLAAIPASYSMNAQDELPTDAHRAMLVILQGEARGRAHPIRTDDLRRRMLKQYSIEVADRDMRHIRRELVAHKWPCYPGPHGYFYGLDAEDLLEAKAYLTKKIMPMLDERIDMGWALEADQRRNEPASRGQMDWIDGMTNTRRE